MITLQELFGYLNNILSFPDVEDSSHNGIQVAGSSHVKKVGFSVSASVHAIHKAADLGCDALMVHHGVFWGNRIPMIEGIVKEKIKKLLSHDMSLLAYHLPLDIHEQVGNNWKAAQDLKWENLQGFSPIGKSHFLGVKGDFAEIEVSTFIKKLETYYGHPAHVALGGKEKVRSAALISGGAHKYIEQAAKEGVDCFITGSFDEPIWHLAHELKVNFMALGHYATERVCVKALKSRIEKDLKINCEFIDECNPF